MTVIEKINEGIKDAMRSKDLIRLNTLRMLKSKILAVDARCSLPDADVLKLFKTYFGNLQEALEQSEVANRSEMSEQLRKEIAIVQEFLPKVPSPEETKKIIEEAIAESGAQRKKDLGLVMKSALKINSDIDGKLAKDFAFEILVD